MSGDQDIRKIYVDDEIEKGKVKKENFSILIMALVTASFLIFILFVIAISDEVKVPGYEDSIYQHYFMAAIILNYILIILRIYLVYWIIKDSMERGMSSPPGWGLFVLFFPIIGMIFYYYFRPEGDLVKCDSCENRMSEILHECPHCRYRKEKGMKKRRRVDGRI